MNFTWEALGAIVALLALCGGFVAYLNRVIETNAKFLSGLMSSFQTKDTCQAITAANRQDMSDIKTSLSAMQQTLNQILLQRRQE